VANKKTANQKNTLYIMMAIGIICYVFRDPLQTALAKYVGSADFGALGALIFGIGLILLLLQRPT
jgi:hypothetical protein